MAKLQPCTNMDKIHQLLDKFTSGVEFLPDPIKDQRGRLYNKYVCFPKVVKKERNIANKKMDLKVLLGNNIILITVIVSINC